MQHFGWGMQYGGLESNDGKGMKSLESSYEAFLALRKMGIRAHSWV